jgi:hypothetical protein
VAYGFDIVAVRIEHEGGVIGGVVLGPEPWRPVVSAPCRDRGMIENIDGGTAWSHEGDMQGPARLRALTDPEDGLPLWKSVACPGAPKAMAAPRSPPPTLP